MVGVNARHINRLRQQRRCLRALVFVADVSIVVLLDAPYACPWKIGRMFLSRVVGASGWHYKLLPYINGFWCLLPNVSAGGRLTGQGGVDARASQVAGCSGRN